MPVWIGRWKMSDDKKLKKKTKFSPIFFEVGGAMGGIEKGIHWVTSIILLILSVILIAGIIVSFIRVPQYLKAIIDGESGALVNLLEFAAGIIIVVELIYVIVAQNLESIIEIMMIALTRELIIKYWETWEILVGIIGLAVLFAIRKFLLDEKDKEPHVFD